MKLHFLDKLINTVKDPGRSFRERVFVLLTIITEFFVLCGLAGDVAFSENPVETTMVAIVAIIIPLVTYVGVKTNKVKSAIRFIVIGIVLVFLPILFFFGGGIKGGGIHWIIFAYLYTGLVLSGRWRPLMLVVLTIEAGIFYVNGYFYPEIANQHQESMFYIDSYISLILVGLICCVMVWFEEWLLNEENKRAREETKKVEELNRTQNRFFSNMSHEIRTPINSILGLNEIILRQEDASEEILKDAANIQGAGRMLLALVNDILDFSKIEAGKMDIIPVNYNLEILLSEIVGMIWKRAEEKGLELNIEIDPSIPAELFGDEMRIKQILINLLNNAIKYTKHGSITLTVEKEEIREEQIMLLFSVSDTGMGIKQDAIPYLFDAFQRMDEDKNIKIEGTGLGLAIVKQLVELMGGRITVNSVYTQGSTFMIALWQQVSRKDAIGDVSFVKFGNIRKTEKYIPAFTASEAAILIVDDNEMNLEVERKLLSDTDMTIHTATSGQQALSMTLSYRYDLIFMDHLMPEMDGIECLQNIRNQEGGLNNNIPVIVLTANADSENRELYSRSGFDDYLVKPVTGLQLENMLLNHLPEIKINMTEGQDGEKAQMNTASGYSKKLSVAICTSTMCDLPSKVVNGKNLDILPFSVITGDRSYRDKEEVSTEDLVHYMHEGIEFNSAPPTVEEFENFFGRVMKKAHQIIYLTLAPTFSKEYENAKTAARAYENVIIFNSGFNSCALGLMVLIAHRSAMQGKTTDKILEELTKVKEKVRCSFITTDAYFMMRRGIIGKTLHGIMSTFSFKPVIRVINDKVTVWRLFMGEKEECYTKYIDHVLNRFENPDTDLIIVEHINLTEAEKDMIRERISKRFHFEHIVFQKVCAAMTISCGAGAIGLSFLEKGDVPYNLSMMLSNDKNDEEESLSDEVELQEIAKKESIYYPVNNSYEKVGDESIERIADETSYINRDDLKVSPKEEYAEEIFESIEGIDYYKALEIAGSKKTLNAVLKLFYQTIELNASEIEKCYKANDWDNYIIKVHSLKDSARIIGADELSELALKLENAAKDGNTEFVHKNTDRLLGNYRKYLKYLAEE
ncbi:DegV family protein [Butyrivibrio sp. LC3010]|uniref:DegV family protein n=1 Tax=Butyrivibrio sp. LC3010 TaxID=1280680 RepID=UPI00041A47D5|nr:DegV family protein [Butyrivibrio sp. LC3010]